MKEKSEITLPIIPFLLTCLLAGLKITGHLDVSWWIVFLPMYLGLAIGLLVVVLAAAAMVAVMIGGLFCVGIEAFFNLFRK